VKKQRTYTDDGEMTAALRTAGWHVPDTFLGGVPEYDRDFVRLEMMGRRTRDYYSRRLRMIGFGGGGTVLDAACGVGQWSVVLADLYQRVIGVDLNAGRLAMARELATAEARGRCEFALGTLEELPVADNSCDAVFCYGAFMFTNMPRTLREFRRVVRPGGRLYLNANSLGWCAHLLVDRGLCAGKLDHMRAATRMFGRMLAGRTSQIVVRRRWLSALVEAAGFRIVEIGPEGTINIPGGTPPAEPAYPKSFYGMTAIVELVAEATE